MRPTPPQDRGSDALVPPLPAASVRAASAHWFYLLLLLGCICIARACASRAASEADDALLARSLGRHAARDEEAAARREAEDLEAARRVAREEQLRVAEEVATRESKDARLGAVFIVCVCVWRHCILWGSLL